MKALRLSYTNAELIRMSNQRLYALMRRLSEAYRNARCRNLSTAGISKLYVRIEKLLCKRYLYV